MNLAFEQARARAFARRLHECSTPTGAVTVLMYSAMLESNAVLVVVDKPNGSAIQALLLPQATWNETKQILDL